MGVGTIIRLPLYDRRYLFNGLQWVLVRLLVLVQSDRIIIYVYEDTRFERARIPSGCERPLEPSEASTSMVGEAAIELFPYH